MKIGAIIAKPARQRLLDNSVHTAFKGGECDRLMGSRARTDVHDLDLVQERIERGKRSQPAWLGEPAGIGFGGRKYADKIDVCPIDAP
jgi:hypothetical protein